MTREEILQTKWAKEFQKEDLCSFQEALDFCLNDNRQITIYKTNETGEELWVISIAESDFWLDTKKTKKEAINLCKEMGWKVV